MRKLVEKKCKTYKIGQDFFEDDKVFEFSGDIDFVTWSRALAKNEKANPKKPMFLCVAAAGDCFNNPNKDRLIDHGIKSPDQKNATSAFFIIAWPGSPNICYYAAGDGNVEIEKHFQKTKFLETNSDNGALVLKGTHHGAFNAFNAELFGQMKPRNYVVSAGNQFGHPSKYSLACQFTVPLYGLVLTIPKPQLCWFHSLSTSWLNLRVISSRCIPHGTHTGSPEIQRIIARWT